MGSLLPSLTNPLSSLSAWFRFVCSMYTILTIIDAFLKHFLHPVFSYLAVLLSWDALRTSPKATPGYQLHTAKMDTNSDQEMPLDGCAFSYSPRTRRKGTRESFHPYRRPTECQSQTEFAQKLSTRGSSRPQQSSVDVSDSLSQDAEGETDDEVDGAYDVDESPSHSSSISLDAPTHPHQIPGPTVSSYSAYSTQLATVYTLVKSAPRREPITIELPQPSILPSLEIASTQPSLTTSRKRRRKAIELVPTTLYNTFWIWTFVRLVMEMRRREGGLEALTMSTT